MPRLSTSLLAILGALSLAASARAQLENPAFDVGRFEELLHVSPGPMDDVVVVPGLGVIVSRPDLSAVGWLTPGQPVPFVPLPLPPVAALALEIGPDGALYVGDGTSGSVLRVDLLTGSFTTVGGGFQIPIDLAFDPAGNLLVVDLTGTDFFLDPCDLWHLTLAGGVETSRTLLLPGLPGAADVAIDAFGRIWAASLGSITVWMFDPITAQLTTPIVDAAGPTDVLPLADGRVLVSTIGFAEVIEFDPARGSVDRLAQGLGAAGGVEDLALADDGRLLAVVQPGLLVGLDAGSALRQEEPAQIGQPCTFRLAIPGGAGFFYAVGLSGSAWSGIVAAPGAATLPIDQDALFTFTLTPRPPNLIAFDGVLSASADAAPILVVPQVPALAGATLYMAALVIPGPSAPPASWIATNAARVTIAP